VPKKKRIGGITKTCFAAPPFIVSLRDKMQRIEVESKGSTLKHITKNVY